MYELDVAATQWINGWAGRSGAVDVPMIWISWLGVPLMVLAVAGQWWLWMDRRHTRHVLVASGLSFLLGLALNQAVLFFVHRLRPYDAGISQLLISPSADFSFPSDHATATFAAAAAFLLHGFRRRAIGLLALAVLVSVSRIYLGTHYAGDVLGGVATGIVAAVAVRVAYREGTRLDTFVTDIL